MFFHNLYIVSSYSALQTQVKEETFQGVPLPENSWALKLYFTLYNTIRTSLTSFRASPMSNRPSLEVLLKFRNWRWVLIQCSFAFSEIIPREKIWTVLFFSYMRSNRLVAVYLSTEILKLYSLTSLMRSRLHPCLDSRYSLTISNTLLPGISHLPKKLRVN